jgi:allantoicase
VNRCLDDHDGDCSGVVEEYPSLAGTGTMIPRCEHHYEKHEERHYDHLKVYPDSSIAPSWFDPAAAGEHWDNDY